MLTIVFSTAFAVPVVFTGGDDAAADALELAAVAGVVGPEPVSFDSLRLQAAKLQSGGRVWGCEAKEPARSLAEALVAAHRDLLFLELEAAEEGLGQARALVRCGASYDAGQLARIELLDGIRHELAGRPDRARARFDAAIRYDPQVAWDDAFSPDRRAQFDKALEERTAPQVSFAVHPDLPVKVDAREWNGTDVAAGERVVEVGGITVLVNVDPSIPDVLVVPAAFPPAALGWIVDDSRRDQLSALLQVTLGEGVRAAVMWDGVLWTGTTGRVDWTPHVSDPTAGVDPIAKVEPRRPRRTFAKVLGVVGTSALIAGGALTAVGVGIAADAVREADEVLMAEVPSRSDFNAAGARYRTGTTLITAGSIAMGGGGAVGMVGVVWTLAPRRK